MRKGRMGGERGCEKGKWEERGDVRKGDGRRGGCEKRERGRGCEKEKGGRRRRDVRKGRGR